MPTFATTTVAGSSAYAGSSVMAVAVDANGVLYLSDATYHNIVLLYANGTSRVLAGSGTSGTADGTGTGASFYYPSGVALDSSGNLYGAAAHCRQRAHALAPPMQCF